MRNQVKTPRRTFASKLYSAMLLGLAWLITLNAGALAQQDNSPKRGVNFGAGYSASDIENISLSNGNLMLNIPLAKLPASRGGLSTGVSLVYNGKLWDTVTEYVDNPYGVLGGNYPYTIVQAGNGGGWSLASGYWVEVKTKPNQYGPPCGEYQHYDPDDPRGGVVGYPEPDAYFRYKVIVHFPDGSTHEMVPYGFSFPNGVGPGGWSNVYGSGVTVSCQDFHALEYGPGATFYSTDGSYLRLVVNPTTAGNSWTRNWTLYSPDGTKVETTNSGQKLYDRNNNFVNVGLSDQLGRQITTTNVGADGNQYVSQMGFGGQTLTWTIHWKTIWVYKPYKAYNEFFNNGIPADGGNRELFTSLFVVDKVTHPSQLGSQEMLFAYDGSDTRPLNGQYTGWGNLTQYTLLSPPSEPVSSRAKVVYSYNTANVLATIHPEDFTNVAVTQKALTYRQEYDGSYQTDTWTYNIFPEGGSGSVSGPGGTGASQSSYPDYMGAFGGLVYRSTNADGSVVEKKWLSTSQPPTAAYPVGDNPYVKTEFTSIPNAAGTLVLTAIKDYTVDQNGNVRTVTEYDYVPYSSVPRDQYGKPTGIPASAVPVRTTENTYHVNVPVAGSGGFNPSDSYAHPSAPRVINAVASTRLRIGGVTGPTVSYSEMTYDNPRTTANPTVVRSWDSTRGALSAPLTISNSNAILTQFDQFGNQILITDAMGIQTQIEYGLVGSVTGLYPTRQTKAYQTPLQRSTSTVYDFMSGLVTSGQDENNVLTTMNYDGAGRRIEQIVAVGTPQQARTRTLYQDEKGRSITYEDTDQFGDERRISAMSFDQLGRIRLSQTLDDPSQKAQLEAEQPGQEVLGYKTQTRYATDNAATPNGSYVLQSNPYRSATSAQATAPEDGAMGWTVLYKDKSGRDIWKKTFAGVGIPNVFPIDGNSKGNNANETGTVTTSYDAETITITDQAGKSRRIISDALGRLIRVDEANAAGQLGGVTAPTQPTYYQYDVLGNLTQIQQGAQTRTYSYSSLNKLLNATTPETGTTSYAYDLNGNLAVKTDARGVVTTSTFDVLNRPVSKSYSSVANVGGTSTISYFYDGQGVTGGTVNYAINKLTKVVNDVSSFEYRNFDALGRNTEGRQILDGVNYDSSYTFNLAGSLVKETYPSGRVVEDVYSQGASNLSSVSSRGANGVTRTYASGFVYSPKGKTTKFQYGNGLWEEASYNDREQLVGISLRKQTTSLWSVSYDYGTTDNNGNLKSQTILHPGITQPLVQTYLYDSLNRLTQAREVQNNVEQWKQTFSYDRFGNRTVDVNQTTPSLVGPNPVINPTNNRITPQVGEAYAFDVMGNMTIDKNGRKFVYDGEARVVQFFSNQTNPTPSAEYRYDATGSRVKKIVGNEVTYFIYDAMGKMVSEYTVNSVALTPRTQYMTMDGMKSQRVITDEKGTVTARRDFAPFGEELQPNTVNRQTAQGYGSANDKTKQKFATYQRDEETGMDFAQQRYYQSEIGRFTSADKYEIVFESARSENPSEAVEEYLIEPQNFSRYRYCLNNPLKHLDPSGMRELTKGENEALARLRSIAAQVDKDKNNLDKDLGNALRAAADEIEAKIHALKDTKERGNIGVKVAISAIWQLSAATAFPNDGEQKISGKGFTLIVGGTNKCNALLALCHVEGAGVGFQGKGKTPSGGGYPLVDGKRLLSANELGTTRDDLTNLTRIDESQIQPGDIVAWRNKKVNDDPNPDKNAGHSAIYIGGGVVVYAGQSKENGKPKAATLNYAQSTFTHHKTRVVRRYTGK
jgi:RHS repeat-associated protein